MASMAGPDHETVGKTSFAPGLAVVRGNHDIASCLQTD